MLIGKATKKDCEAVWKTHKEFFLKKLAADQHQPFDRGKLEYRFIDMNGKTYWAFPKDLPKPIERLGQEMNFMMWMSSGLSSKEIDSLFDAMDKALMHGIKTGKNGARIGALIEEGRKRKSMVLHTELLYNYIACCWIREDENPLVYNNDIQKEKVDQFKKEVAESGSYFFFRKPELERLNYLWNLTEGEWNQYWQDSLLKQEMLPQVLKTISSGIESESETKTRKKP